MIWYILKNLILSDLTSFSKDVKFSKNVNLISQKSNFNSFEFVLLLFYFYFIESTFMIGGLYNLVIFYSMHFVFTYVMFEGCILVELRYIYF